MNNMAICQINLGRHHDALAMYRDLVVQNPGAANLHNNLAQALQSLGRHDEAVVAFRRAMSLAKDGAEGGGKTGRVKARWEAAPM